MATKRYQVLIPGPHKCSLEPINGGKELDMTERVNSKENGSLEMEVKDPDLGRLSWIIQLGSECNYKCPYKNTAEGDLTQKRREQCGHEGKDWEDNAATSQREQAATRSWKKQQILPSSL